MFLKGIWFIIAGVLLLGHNPGLAEPYLRVGKNGVDYYHFSSREPAQTKQGGKNTSKPRGEVWIQVPPVRQKLPKAPLLVKSKVKPQAVALTSAPALGPLMPITAENLQVVNPSDPKGMIFAGTDSLLRLLTKLGCRYPLPLPADAAGLPRVDRHKEVPASHAPKIVAPEAWNKLLKDAQEPPVFYAEPGGLGYSFPVAGPFSFRDTWGEGRSGGRLHRAVDVFAPEGTEVYAITAGVIDSLSTGKESGITLIMRGQDGKGYGYMHLQGYAPGVAEGKAVKTGELIGYVGRTGIQSSAAHLHFQVYADHRLCRDELLNPYIFLVQLCHGVGVTDLYPNKIARLEVPEKRVKGLEVYRRPDSIALRGRIKQFNAKNSSVLVIKNF